MARVIDTPSGALLTSPTNAHSFTRGDVVVVGTEEVGYAVLTVVDNRIPVEAPARRWLEFETATAPNVAGCGAKTGGGFGMEFGANEPLNRVVGGRSGAGGSHS
jgi:hypothetical protein